MSALGWSNGTALTDLLGGPGASVSGAQVSVTVPGSGVVVLTAD